MLVERQRKRTLRAILKTANPALRRALYQDLAILTAMQRGTLPSLSTLPAPAET